MTTPELTHSSKPTIKPPACTPPPDKRPPSENKLKDKPLICADAAAKYSKIATKYIALHLLLDKGCTGHYVPPDVDLEALRPNVISVQIPDARRVLSTHAGLLPALRDLPSLPFQITHQILSLKTSPLSISTLCEDDCIAVFTKEGFYIFNKNKLV